MLLALLQSCMDSDQLWGLPTAHSFKKDYGLSLCLSFSLTHTYMVKLSLLRITSFRPSPLFSLLPNLSPLSSFSHIRLSPIKPLLIEPLDIQYHKRTGSRFVMNCIITKMNAVVISLRWERVLLFPPLQLIIANIIFSLPWRLLPPPPHRKEESGQG